MSEWNRQDPRSRPEHRVVCILPGTKRHGDALPCDAR